MDIYELIQKHVTFNDDEICISVDEFKGGVNLQIHDIFDEIFKIEVEKEVYRETEYGSDYFGTGEYVEHEFFITDIHLFEKEIVLAIEWEVE